MSIVFTQITCMKSTALNNSFKYKEVKEVKEIKDKIAFK